MSTIDLNAFADNIMQTVGIKEQTVDKPTSKKSSSTQTDVTASFYTDIAFHVIDEDLAMNYENLVSDIAKYSMLTENVHDLHDESQRINLFAKLSYGLRKSGEAKAWVSFHRDISESEAEAAEGIAALDEFPAYLALKASEGNDIKATDSNRKWYVSTNENVLTAKKKVAMLKAMDQVITIYKSQFTNSIGTLKAMIYGIKDSDYLSGSDSKQTYGDK